MTRLALLTAAAGVLVCGCADAAPPHAEDPARGASDTAATAGEGTAAAARGAGDGRGLDSAAVSATGGRGGLTPPVLIDPDIPPAVAGEDGWNYQQSASADLDGDGAAERVVLTARVELYRGRPAWDDGQPWQVYVEEADGTRTHLYARRLQLGTLRMRVTTRTEDRPPTIVLLEHLPHRLSVHEASYAGPGRATVATPFQREVDPTGDTASPQLP